jgi:hypothetical protein
MRCPPITYTTFGFSALVAVASEVDMGWEADAWVAGRVTEPRVTREPLGPAAIATQ